MFFQIWEVLTFFVQLLFLPYFIKVNNRKISKSGHRVYLGRRSVKIELLIFHIALPLLSHSGVFPWNQWSWCMDTLSCVSQSHALIWYDFNYHDRHTDAPTSASNIDRTLKSRRSTSSEYCLLENPARLQSNNNLTLTHVNKAGREFTE